MRIRSLSMGGVARFPEDLRQILLRAGARACEPDREPPVRLEICDAEPNFICSVALRDLASLYAVQRQAVEVGYRALRLAGTEAGETCRVLLVRNRTATATAAARPAGARAGPPPFRRSTETMERRTDG
jgi:hypothetical protein